MFGEMGFDFTGATTTLHTMGTKFSERLPYFLIALIIFLFAYWLSKRIRNATTKLLMKRSQNSRNVSILIGRTASGAIMTMGAFIALTFAVPDFTPSHLVSIFGFVSVGLGIAFRDVIANLLAGVFILYSEPFQIGDSISSGGFEGTVEQIQTRATFLKTPEGKRVVIPNAQLYNSPVLVNSAYQRRRVEFNLRIALENDAEAANREISQAIGKMEIVLESPQPEVALSELSAEGATFTIRFWINTANNIEVLSAKNAALIQIKAAFEKAGIVFAATPAKVEVPSVSPPLSAAAGE